MAIRPSGIAPPAAGAASESSHPFFATLMSRYAPIDLAEMSTVALLDRTDTKYVLSEKQLYVALTALVDRYRVLDICGLRLNRYRTLYYDTADFTLFQQHHARRRNRFKVRARNYVDSRLSFLEVKHKLKRARTIKNRMPTAGLLTWLTPEANAFLNDSLPFDPDVLEPRLWNEYTRITLVSRRDRERLTLDLNLRYMCHQSHVATGRSVVLPRVVIAEVKQDGLNRNSDFIGQMRAMGIRPLSFSKYCIGVAMLYEGVKHNNFKPNLRLVERLMRGE